MKTNEVKIGDKAVTTGIQRLGNGKYRFSVRKGSYREMRTKKKTFRFESDDQAIAHYLSWYDATVSELQQQQFVQTAYGPQLGTFVKKGGQVDRFGRHEVLLYQGTTAHNRVKSEASWIRIMSSLRMVQSGRRLEELGKKQLGAITQNDVQEALTSLNKDLKNTTIRNFQNNLAKVFRLAVENKILPEDFKNPVEGTVIGRIEPKLAGKTSLYADEYQPVLDEVLKMEIRHRLFYMLALTTGMRRGEIMALEFEDIDLKSDVIRIEHSMTEYTGVGHTVLGFKDGTKNGKNRTTILPTVLRPVLAEYLASVKPIPWIDNEGKERHLLFMNPKTGQPYTLSSYTQNWDRTRDRWLKQGILVKKTTLHDLRASFITYLLVKENISADTVARMVGHANPEITHRIYANVGEADIAGVDIDL